MEEDPFPDSSLHDSINSEQHGNISAAGEDTKVSAKKKGLSKVHHKVLRKTVADNVDNFCCSFSSGPPAELLPLKIELTKDAKPLKVSLRKYSADRWQLLSSFVKNLVRHSMAYPNPMSQ